MAAGILLMVAVFGVKKVKKLCAFALFISGP